MSNDYFSIERDKQFPCWCQTCLVGKTLNEMSPDTRYCRWCYNFLLKEAGLLGETKRPRWIPKPQTKPTEAKIEGEKQYHIVQPIDKEKTKMSTLNPPSVTVDKFRPRGRPKTYKKHSLPDDKIRQLHKEGMGTKAIATYLKTELGIDVSYKTIQRVLSGERN